MEVNDNVATMKKKYFIWIAIKILRNKIKKKVFEK